MTRKAPAASGLISHPSPFIASQLEQYHLVRIQEARTAQGDSILIGEQSVWYRIASGRGLSGSGASILGVELWVNLLLPSLTSTRSQHISNKVTLRCCTKTLVSYLFGSSTNTLICSLLLDMRLILEPETRIVRLFGRSWPEPLTTNIRSSFSLTLTLDLDQKFRQPSATK